MRIGIDLDGVVFDSENYFRACSELFDIKINGKGMVSPNELKAQHRYDWDKTNLHKFLSEYVVKGEEISPTMPLAKEVIDMLKKDGHTLITITSRGCIDGKEIEVTKERLNKAGISFDKEYYSITNKLEICKKENIDLMIDDLYDTIKLIAENNIKCLYFRAVGIKKYEHENIQEVHNWGEIYRKIREINEKTAKKQ